MNRDSSGGARGMRLQHAIDERLGLHRAYAAFAARWRFLPGPLRRALFRYTTR